MPSGRVAASVPENLSLFLDPPGKSEESSSNTSSSKKMSKDSILSLYATSSMPQTNMAAAHGEAGFLWHLGGDVPGHSGLSVKILRLDLGVK